MLTIPDQNRLSTQTFAAWADAFTPAELDRIEALGDALAPEHATLSNRDAAQNVAAPSNVRVTRTAWMQQTPETDWLYERMRQIVVTLNNETYKYELNGFSEPFQYTVYQDHEGGHYDWHIDHGALPIQRKLSVSVQLSDPTDYDGCDLQFMAGNKMEVAPRERGAVIVFPSYVLHRVTPVTRGIRKSVVVWVSGPNFR